MISPIGLGPLGASEWSIPSVSGTSSVSPLGAGSASALGAGSGSGTTPSFSNALSNAIGSLETAQANATTASQQLATGQLSDPTTAVTAVENASLAMDFASAMRNGIDTDVSTLMQTSF
jgi:flagellar hook-basal body complex protein FliE